MSYSSIPTRGRTLDYAAGIYDILEPWIMFGFQEKINRQVIDHLKIELDHRILDVGCGTGVVTRMISEKLSPEKGGVAVGIDAAGKMIQGAVEKRQGPACTFRTAAAEALPFENELFDALECHHPDHAQGTLPLTPTLPDA